MKNLKIQIKIKMTMDNMLNGKGVTLIELVIGMVLISIVALVVANALSTGITGFFVTDYRKEALDQARGAMDRMAKEIRNINSRSDIGTATATQLCFRAINNLSDSDANNDYIIISFRLSGNAIIREDGLADLAACPGSAGSTLATGISNATLPSGIFTYVESGGTETQTPTVTQIKRIKIDFRATAGTESITLQSEVWPRNL
jgi:prepilin-type N-terminal cleavage/methylation domain-containing protein